MKNAVYRQKMFPFEGNKARFFACSCLAARNSRKVVWIRKPPQAVFRDFRRCQLESHVSGCGGKCEGRLPFRTYCVMLGLCFFVHAHAQQSAVFLKRCSLKGDSTFALRILAMSFHERATQGICSSFLRPSQKNLQLSTLEGSLWFDRIFMAISKV